MTHGLAPNATDTPGRYAVLRHRVPTAPAGDRRSDHYDWMFEVDGKLLTWASEHFLPRDRDARVIAALLPPHRLIYLDYEGAISENRGTVERIEAGRHRLLCCSVSRYEFAVDGDRRGIVAIYRTRSDVASESWVIEFGPNRDERPTRADAS